MDFRNVYDSLKNAWPYSIGQAYQFLVYKKVLTWVEPGIQRKKIRIWIMKCIPHSVVKMSYNLCLYILPKVKHHILLISSHWGKHITFSNFYIFFPHFCITQLVKRCGRKMWSLYVPIFIWPFTEYYFCWLFKHLILFDVLMSLRPWPNCFIALLLYRLCEKHTAH